MLRRGDPFAPERRWQRVFYRVVRDVVVFLSRLYFRLTVTGQENVPPTGPVIIAPVHRSNLDTPFIAASTRRRLRAMGKDSLWKSWFGHQLFTALGGFPVHRGTADREALRMSQQVLEAGDALVLFPEGTRRSGPVVENIFDGAAYLACRLQVPIVPVGIGGSEGAMPKGSKWIRPVKVAMVVGPVITPPPPTDGGRTSRKAVKALSGELEVELQCLFDEAQRRAGIPAG